MGKPPVVEADTVWDLWRLRYPEKTVAEERDFYTALWKISRDQKHFDLHSAIRAVNDAKPKTVVEIGGWDGELAATLLDAYKIEKWTLVEICEEAAMTARLRRHPRLVVPRLKDWYWDNEWEADLFVASHVIEHLSEEDFAKVMRVTDAKWLFIDAPLANAPTDWTGYDGTHKLGVGWNGVDEILFEYEVMWRVPHTGKPSKFPHGEARLYKRKIP